MATKPNVLFVDDEDRRYDICCRRISSYYNVHRAKTLDDFIRATDNEIYQILFLDHDLQDLDANGKELTGTDICRHIRNNKNKFDNCTIVIHSSNSYAIPGMLDYLKSTACKVHVIHEAWCKVRVINEKMCFAID